MNVAECDITILLKSLLNSITLKSASSPKIIAVRRGLKINDIVFNEHGMIGRVLELGDFSSKVITLYDQDSVIPVFSMETKQSFFVKGSDNKLLIKHLDGPFSLKHNEVLITTKAAGYFKEGIKVGKVKKTLNEVYVEPFAKLSDTIYYYSKRSLKLHTFKPRWNSCTVIICINHFQQSFTLIVYIVHLQ